MSGWTWRAPKDTTRSRAAAAAPPPGGPAHAGDVDALAGGRCPAGRLGEDPEDRGLVQPELAIPGADPEDDLLRPDPIAVVERLDGGLGRIAVGEDMADQVLRLVDP